MPWAQMSCGGVYLADFKWEIDFGYPTHLSFWKQEEPLLKSQVAEFK
jgi:hypothetical protein